MFGLSGSKSKSSSTGQSSSFSFGRSDSFDFSRAGGESVGTSRAGSTDSSRARSTQRIAFEDVFARLFGDAERTAANLDTSVLTDASNQLFSGGMDVLGRLGGDAGSEYLNNRLQGNNQVLDAQLELLQSNVGDLFREELLPAITSEAVAGGALGGGRQGVAQGQAAEAASDAFQRGAVELRSRDQAQRDALAGGIADRSIQGAQIGLAGLPGLIDVAAQGLTAQMAPMEFLARILGNRDVLTESTSESSGESFSSADDFARNFAEAFGFSTSRDRSGSRSTTHSTSSSKSFGIGF